MLSILAQSAPVINNNLPSTPWWQQLLPALLGVLGVLAGAVVAYRATLSAANAQAKHQRALLKEQFELQQEAELAAFERKLDAENQALLSQWESEKYDRQRLRLEEARLAAGQLVVAHVRATSAHDPIDAGMLQVEWQRQVISLMNLSQMIVDSSIADALWEVCLVVDDFDSEDQQSAFKTKLARAERLLAERLREFDRTMND